MIGNIVKKRNIGWIRNKLFQLLKSIFRVVLYYLLNVAAGETSTITFFLLIFTQQSAKHGQHKKKSDLKKIDYYGIYYSIVFFNTLFKTIKFIFIL